MTDRMKKATDVFKKLDMSGGPSTCWLFQGELNSKGLPYVQYKGKKLLAYRMTYELTHGPVPNGHVVRHSCDTPACCNPHHLTTGTQQDNMNDMKERDRHGAPAHVVRAIRKLWENGDTHVAIAEKYGLARQTVTDIINKTTHKHVKDGEDDQRS